MKWSYSSMKLFEQCPRKYFHLRVLKDIVEPESEAMLYGTRFHEAAELYIKDGTQLPPQFSFLQETLDALKAKPGRKLCEHKMGVTKDLKPCGFHDKDMWVRGIADLLIIDDDGLKAWVIDYKTGNDKYPDRDQLILMSLMVFAHFPHIRQVNSALLFVVKNSMVKHKMTIDDKDFHWWRYRERVAKLANSFANNVWNPTQTPLCNWCDVKTCEFNPKH